MADRVRITRHLVATHPNRDDHEVVVIRAGRPKLTRVVPPAGERHAFVREDYPVEVQVAVSPTGRSVQVYVNGERVR